MENGSHIAKSRAERFMLHVLEAINTQAANHWTKIEDFFKLLLKVTIGGDN